MRNEPSQGPGTNTGHGHVWKRPDRAVARCGGPALCSRCQADQAAFPEPPLVSNKPPIFVDQGNRIEVSWPNGRGLFWTTPDAAEGWAAQVNELRAERAQLRELLARALDGLDAVNATLVAIASEAERTYLDEATRLRTAAATRPAPPPLHPTRRDLDRMEGP